MPVLAAKSVGVIGMSIPDNSQIANERASRIICNLRKARKLRASHTANMQQDKNGGENYLQAWREFRRLSREDLAAAIDPPTTGAVIWHLEEGERGLSAKWLRRLAPALRTTPGHLLDHDPRNLERDILDLWGNASDAQRAQITQLAETVVQYQVQMPAATDAEFDQLAAAAKRSKRQK